MSLEDKIDALSANIKMLADVMKGQSSDKADCCKPEKEVKKKATTKKKEPEKEQKEVKEEAAKPTSDTFDEIKAVVVKLASASPKGRDKVLDILGGFDAAKVTEVSEADYPALLEKLEVALNG
jgi:hypothetical protein